LRWKNRNFSQVTLDSVSSYIGIHTNGIPQPSLDVDANRLVLLDRLTQGQIENGDNGHSEETADIPF